VSRTLVSAALRYAALGWPVFPCAPRSKVPLLPNPHPRDDPARQTCHGYRDCGRLGHGVLDATTDPAVIADEMWRRNPRANIGIACGWPGPDVVDVDVAHGKPGRATVRRLREAGLLRGAHAVVRTPTGGRHLYFAGREGGQGNGGLAAFGIDFRSTGGYVVAPPSVTPAGRYRFTRYRPPTG
jgi:Bifunctional DNA primase/polymerase, N-terminal